jgi:hypothetical protein
MTTSTRALSWRASRPPFFDYGARFTSRKS